MADPTRQAALATLREGQARIDELSGRLSDEDLRRPATIGDGDWSANDLIGHLATWEELALQSLREFRAGQVPWVETPDGVFSAPATVKIDAFNAEAVAKKRAQPPDAVGRRARDIHHELVDTIERMSDEVWVAKAFYETPSRRRRKLCTLLGAILAAPRQPFGHAFAHVPDLAAFVVSLPGSA